MANASVISVRTFPRTVDFPGCKISDEPNKPKTSNLATHLRTECKAYKAKQAKAAAAAADNDPNVPASVEYNLPVVSSIMKEFLTEGSLNPAINPTRAGFLKIFALWILDEDLPWTTGESPMLRDLFKYLRVNQQLPSDTTVRNELARIFADLHGKVVREFAV